METQPKLFILGATGFIGKQVVKEALERGCRVKALVRTAEKAAGLAAMGAEIVVGDAESPEAWTSAAAGCTMLFDLVQPALPKRIGMAEVRRIASRRKTIAQRLCTALLAIPHQDRPLLVSVSGLDDLLPDSQARVHDASPPREQLTGFSHIGVPVRRLIEETGVTTTFAYLATVYGPGKTFEKTIFPQLAAGRFRIPGSGSNRTPLIHVEDAARALVHLAHLGPKSLAGRSFVIADGSQPTMSEFFGFASESMNVPRPRNAPAWLAQLAAGKVLCETLTRNIVAVPTALRDTGFQFRYPSYREGLPPTLRALGYEKQPHIEKQGTAFWVLLVLAVGALIVENGFNFPLSVPWMTHLTEGAPILDMRPGYSEADAYKLLDVLGETGRAAYLKLLWTVDLILPLLFGLFLSAAIQRGAFRRLKWAPFVATALDYAENIAITFLLLGYPLHHPGVVGASSALTLMKFAAYLTAILLAIAGGIVRRPSRRPGSSRDKFFAKGA
jgi:nucleoside-diphosphate-sugar epimerase